MKIVSVIAKILTALATVIGAIFVLATYGEQIVAWCKKFIDSLPVCVCVSDDDSDEEEEAFEVPAPVEEVAEEAVEEPAAEEVPVEEAPVEEPVAEEIPADAVVADDSDFEG